LFLLSLNGTAFYFPAFIELKIKIILNKASQLFSKLDRRKAMQNFKDVTFIAISCLLFLMYLGGVSSAQDVNPGVDLFVTPPSSGSYINFSGSPIPADYFGPGSDPFDGVISFQGQPLDTSPPDILGPTDTIVRRLDTAGLPACGSSDTVPIQIVALSLVSVSPITVTYNGGQTSEPWDVQVCLSSSVPQDTGSLTITRQCNEGGTFASDLPVRPRLTFTKVDPPHDQRLLDFGDFGYPSIPLSTSNGYWLYSDPGFNILTTSGGSVDHDCNPGTGYMTFGPSSNFYAGLQGIPCDCSNDPTNHNIVLTFLENISGAAGHGVYPPIQTNIPTLSEWGMLVMGLLLLATGTVAVIRHRRKALRAVA
jgi:hypothetical protein